MGADEAGGWQQGGKGRVPAATQEPEAETRGGLLLAESGMVEGEEVPFTVFRWWTGGCRMPMPNAADRTFSSVPSQFPPGVVGGARFHLLSISQSASLSIYSLNHFNKII